MASIAASAAARCRNTAAARGTRMSIATAIPPANGTHQAGSGNHTTSQIAAARPTPSVVNGAFTRRS